MVDVYGTPYRVTTQPQSGLALEQIIDALPDRPLLARLGEYRWVGRPGYPLRAMWRAYAASFVLNLGSTNDLIRRLAADPKLARLCGFRGPLPHRTTFNRFIARLGHHADLVERCFAGVTEELRVLVPGLGREVAVDASVVRSNTNPNSKRKVDKVAGWTVKNTAGAKGGKEWRHGYKLHALACADTGALLGMAVSTASVNDSPWLPVLMDRARATFPWLRPTSVMADRGYDAESNYLYCAKGGGAAIIPLRKPPGGGARKSGYTADGTPMCGGRKAMEYVYFDGGKGHLFRCAGCGRGSRPCGDMVWVQPASSVRVVGIVPRRSPAWPPLYAKRQAIERAFKGMKESRRLERHYVRGLRAVRLHCLMAGLVYQATLLVNARAGRAPTMRWQVARVA